MTKSMIAIAVATLLMGSVDSVHAQRLIAVTESVRIERNISEISNATYRLSNSKDVVMNLSGTTPVKDWAMTANGLSGEAIMGFTRNNELARVDFLDFKLPVRNLKGEVKAMDEDAYEALKADQHKEITFKLIDATIEGLTSSSYKVAAKGKLSVAGVTRTVTLKMNAQVARDGAVTFTGSQHLKMSDYDVERPSLLFGAIKASNDMTLTYKLIFKK